MNFVRIIEDDVAFYFAMGRRIELERRRIDTSRFFFVAILVQRNAERIGASCGGRGYFDGCDAVFGEF